MSDQLRALMEDAEAEGRGLLFLSPHLDDAVLSCGALLSTLGRRLPITVATVFSAAAPPPHTRAACTYLRQCAATGALDLYDERRREDIEVLAGLGVEHVHLGITDALFRQRQVGRTLTRIGRVVPEVVHRYPTFRLDIDRGRVSRGDRALLELLHHEVRTLAERIDAAVVLSPVGVGRHVDHLLTRSLGERHRTRVHYSDFPYDRRHEPDPTYLSAHRLTRITWDEGIHRRPDLIRAYRTQADALFPTGDIPATPETYYLPPWRAAAS
ncbi:GlcNAc-PI de-N-acetylase [Geodermatophilus africanus]|uniref:GlcNAc-PI de-N-acetylase n=1 Tax=Geodermatophilus africanus TaxID=1137993 RepID=A0A1H3Q7K8_9ACTN|nr:PIG-L family deacetylase [Geodermatophilus africanus]SDZ08689.1 GlcNAc-PI de-N-acetylase [Geodermatophilus africanus]